nr:WecB/TagA/CpsF family glycosyltransferase [Nodosilinea sp. TSF1-S3]MDF0367304.1 WecB/TagA/CpsF family glycosyltransferase [Nodosilinea sp. TSF1-S3]
MHWAHRRLSRVVCVANVHMLMEARWNESFAKVLKHADLLTPDGMPLVWTLNLLRKSAHDRVAGMYILLEVCRRASACNLPVYFLGTDELTLGRMRQQLAIDFPALTIAGMEPLPFRPLSPEEDAQVVRTINESKAGVVFVALGCPKQEAWMYSHRNQIHAAMVGVGGVFPIYAGIKKHAPTWVQESGLEWLYRLIQEPGRLWQRYFKTIPPFIYLSMKQVVTTRLQRRIHRMLRMS